MNDGINLISRGKPPPDAVVVEESEAVFEQWKLMETWKPKRDVLALLYGPALLATAGGLSGFVMNSYYRRKMKLGMRAHLASYIPMVIMPSVFSAFFHRAFVSSKIVIHKDRCIVCSEVKAVAIQSGIGLVYPLVLAPASSYMLANSYATYRIPDIFGDRRKFFHFHMEISKKLYQKLPVIFGLQALVTIILTYLEYKDFFRVTNKLAQFEKHLREQGEIL